MNRIKTPTVVYIIKCLLGLGIGYWLFLCFPNHPFYWTLVSILLVMAPDTHDSAKLAFDRVKANAIGSIIGMVLFVSGGPALLMMAIGIVVTILICSLLKLMTIGRSALAALLIVTVHEKRGHTWEIALERMGCVILGCVIALVISTILGYLTKE